MKFCADYNISNIGEEVTLNGWVAKVRNLGGVIFIDLRDRSGIMQLVIKPESPVYDLASTLHNEYVINITGKIIKRESVNKNVPTGEIEVEVSNLLLLNKSLEIPFAITDDTTALEDTRLKYRYLDIRRSKITNNLVIVQKEVVYGSNLFLFNIISVCL